MVGLAGSGLARPGLALAGLVAYLLLQLHIALKAHATGVFKIAFGGVGGTELRILVAVLNTVIFLVPGRDVAPGISLVDAALIGALALMGLALLRDAVATALALDRAERGRADPADCGGA
jgi:hypothetical protein